MIETQEFLLPDYDTSEIFRYAGVAAQGRDPSQLAPYLDLCKEFKTGKVCWTTVPVSIDGDRVSLGSLNVKSNGLSINLKNCSNAILFGATIGIRFDMLIRKTMARDLAGSIWLQAIGTERIEALCNGFCEEQERKASEKGFLLKPRFSPGYGDCPLTFQKDMFSLLDCSRHIGLSLTDSCLMVPSKSVTAIIGITIDSCEMKTGCSQCGKINCSFRKAES